MSRSVRFATACTTALVLPHAAGAATVTFTGTVANLCVLTLSTPGLLGLSADGKTLSSSETGGVKAIMAVVSAGSNPTVAFTAPALAGPAASLTGATTSMAYVSPGGAAQTNTSASSTYVLNRLLDTLTIDAHSTNTAGFATGVYTISSTVTCQQ